MTGETGVGLPIVKKIVDVYGGKIRVEPQRRKRATFFIRLPRKNEIQQAGR
ncbi:MAG: HAMP domain-containing histidine kinase [Candidatus Manganitrophaceae bacterium]|nr:MAG: HAMP domain-containing histidine kinase [Candidatus Manganitrophaceae bacterium]